MLPLGVSDDEYRSIRTDWNDDANRGINFTTWTHAYPVLVRVVTF